jgi:hypothetical protein
MDNLEELKSQFLVSSSLSEAKMLSLLRMAIEHCAVDQRGHVEIKTQGLTSRDKIVLILAARYIAHHLDESIHADVTAEEIAKNALIAPDQVRARTSDLVRDKMIESSGRGVFRALAYKIEPFLNGLAPNRAGRSN